MSLLTIENLSKSFGTNKVIDNLSFSVSENTIFGFLGQNGAGKTTTMRMITGLLKPDSGRITICSEPVQFGETKTNRFVGYLPDVPAFYGYMRPMEYLKLCGEITGLSQEKIKSRSEELLALVGLDNANNKISGFSRGMKQRLGIAQALLHEPRLLICDEPTSALDPNGRKEILDILKSMKQKTTIVFSTHILSDVERICDRIVVLHQGNIKLSGTLKEIKAQYPTDRLFVQFATDTEKQQFIAVPELATLLADATIEDGAVTINTNEIGAAQELIIKALAAQQLLPIKLEVLEPTLESLFMEVTQ